MRDPQSKCNRNNNISFNNSLKLIKMNTPIILQLYPHILNIQLPSQILHAHKHPTFHKRNPQNPKTPKTPKPQNPKTPKPQNPKPQSANFIYNMKEVLLYY